MLLHKPMQCGDFVPPARRLVSAAACLCASNHVTGRRISELFTGPFCVTQSNPTHELKSGEIWTQPDTTNNGAYSLVVMHFYAQNLSTKH